MVLPSVSSTNKSLLFFSGGVDSTLIALRMKEEYGNLDNVIAVFFPIHAVYEIYKGTKKALYEKRIKNQHSIFTEMCDLVGLDNRIEFLSYDDFTLKNGDNLIHDQHRCNSVYSSLQLLLEHGVDLNDKASIVVGINKRIFEGLELLDYLNENNITDSEEIKNVIESNPEKYRGIIERGDDLYTNYSWVEKQNSYSILPFNEMIENKKIFLPLQDYTKADVYKLFKEEEKDIMMAAHNTCDVDYPKVCGKCDTCVERAKSIS